MTQEELRILLAEHKEVLASIKNLHNELTELKVGLVANNANFTKLSELIQFMEDFKSTVRFMERILNVIKVVSLLILKIGAVIGMITGTYYFIKKL